MRSIGQRYGWTGEISIRWLVVSRTTWTIIKEEFAKRIQDGI